MQENAAPPRVGQAKLLEHEQKMLSHVVSVSARALAWVVDGDRVAINWVFDTQLKHQTAVSRLDEVAFQEWRGDKILRERFYYDPGSIRQA